MNIDTNLKYSSEIVTRYVNKYSNVRIGSELNLRKIRPFTELEYTCNFVKNDIEEYLRLEDYALAYNRCIVLVKLIEKIVLKLDYSFTVEASKFADVEARLLDDLICIPVRQLGVKYFKATGNKKYMQEAEMLLKSVQRSHSNKCKYAVNMLKLEGLKELKTVFKFMLDTTIACKSYVSLSTYKINTLFLKDIIYEINDVSSVVKESCRCSNPSDYITTLTTSDMGYTGAGDNVIFVKEAKELFIGMQQDLNNNLGYLAME